MGESRVGRNPHHDNARRGADSTRRAVYRRCPHSARVAAALHHFKTGFDLIRMQGRVAEDDPPGRLQRKRQGDAKVTGAAE